MQGLKITDFLISTCEKSYASLMEAGWCKTAFLEVFRPYLEFWSEIKKSVTIYFSLGYVEAVHSKSRTPKNIIWTDPGCLCSYSKQNR